MSKPAANPFMDNEFTKYFDVSKVFDMSKVMEMPKAFQDMKMPQGFGFETMMDAQRKNMQAFAAAGQTAAEGWQTIMRRQSEVTRQTIKESSEMLNAVMTASAPEEKMAKQSEMAKTVMDRSLASAKEMAEMATKTQYEALEVLSKRAAECMEEMRCMSRTNSNCAVAVVGKPANKQ